MKKEIVRNISDDTLEDLLFTHFSQEELKNLCTVLHIPRKKGKRSTVRCLVLHREKLNITLTMGVGSASEVTRPEDLEDIGKGEINPPNPYDWRASILEVKDAEEAEERKKIYELVESSREFPCLDSLVVPDELEEDFSRAEPAVVPGNTRPPAFKDPSVKIPLSALLSTSGFGRIPLTSKGPPALGSLKYDSEIDGIDTPR